MYTQVWNKYLPIIRILMKRAAAKDQSLEMNAIDFERSGAARKSGYKFNIQFKGGRVDNIISSSPLAKDLAATLQEDPVIKDLLSRNDYHINMTAKFQLNIKFIPVERFEEEPVAVSEEEVHAEAPQED